MESLIDKLSQIRDVKKRRVFLERKGFSKPEIENILEKVHLQIKGIKKFPRAHQMKFNRDGFFEVEVTIVTFEFIDGISGIVSISGFYGVKMGDKAYISFPHEKIHIFDMKTETNIIHKSQK